MARGDAASGGQGKTALVVGHEGDGLSAEALDACDYHARIPMAAGVDSLNVATACAIALYELQSIGGPDVLPTPNPIAQLHWELRFRPVGVSSNVASGFSRRQHVESHPVFLYDVVGVGANSVDAVYVLPEFPRPAGPAAKLR